MNLNVHQASQLLESTGIHWDRSLFKGDHIPCKFKIEDLWGHGEWRYQETDNFVVLSVYRHRDVGCESCFVAETQYIGDRTLAGCLTELWLKFLESL